MPKVKPHCRWLIGVDIPTVLAIEQQSWHDTHCPWTEQEMIMAMRQRNCIGMIVEDCNDPFEEPEEAVLTFPVIGFFIYALHKDHLNLLHLAVERASRRQKVGSAIMEKMISKLSHRRTRIDTHVDERNVAAQLFFANCGFGAMGIYQHGDQGLIQMRYVLGARV